MAPLVLVKENNVNNNESSDNVNDDRVVDECNSLKRIARNARPKNNLGLQKRASLEGGKERNKYAIKMRISLSRRIWKAVCTECTPPILEFNVEFRS